MTPMWRPWQRMLPVWVPAVALCLISAVVYAWQTSGSVGNAARLRDQIADLEVELARLDGMRSLLDDERQTVAELDEQFDYLYSDVLGDLDQRLTAILREVGDATRAAQLLPGAYTYSADRDKRLQYIRFGIQFAVAGEFSQIRQLLAALQESPEFLIVEHIGFSGEEDTVTRELRISIKIATYLAEADEETLRRLTGGLGRTAEGDDGEGQGES